MAIYMWDEKTQTSTMVNEKGKEIKEANIEEIIEEPIEEVVEEPKEKK